MIDTHSHIYEPDFTEDVQDVILRAKAAGVEQIYLPNINEGSIAPMLDLAGRHPGYLFPMMGLHPTDVDASYREVLARMETLLAAPNHPYIAVGEIGLDFYWDQTFRTEQLDAFARQLEWAVRYHLPVMIHARSAHQELVETMRQFEGRGLTGVFHCFGGTRDEAEQLLSFDGFCLGVGGVLTYKKSNLPDALSVVPLSRIVLETDSPYLAPVPHRGKRNESSYLTEVLSRLSVIYNVTPQEVENVTNGNAKSLFPLAK